jgi:hypothetical protein
MMAPGGRDPGRRPRCLARRSRPRPAANAPGVPHHPAPRPKRASRYRSVRRPVKHLAGDVRTARIGTDYLLRAMVKSWLRWLDLDITDTLARTAVDSARDVLIEHLAEGYGGRRRGADGGSDRARPVPRPRVPRHTLGKGRAKSGREDGLSRRRHELTGDYQRGARASGPGASSSSSRRRIGQAAEAAVAARSATPSSGSLSSPASRSPARFAGLKTLRPTLMLGSPLRFGARWPGGGAVVDQAALVFVWPPANRLASCSRGKFG